MKRIEVNGLNHRYEVRYPTWKYFLMDQNEDSSIRVFSPNDSANKKQKKVALRIDGLRNAVDHYYWMSDSNTTPQDGEDNTTKVFRFPDTQPILDRLAGGLRNSLNGCVRDADVFLEAIKILTWGDTFRGSVSWLTHHHERGQLGNSVQKAREVLQGDTWDPESMPFSDDIRGIQMDSGLTKVFSLASMHSPGLVPSVIYDSRVAAALGLMSRHALSETDRAAVPPELSFVQMPSTTKDDAKRRNASGGEYHFPRKTKGAKSAGHACSNLLANWIIDQLVRDFEGRWTHREMEASLFMIGYSLIPPSFN
jgi:hypothetical protein